MEIWKSDNSRGLRVAFVLTTPGTGFFEKYAVAADFALLPSDLHNRVTAAAKAELTHGR